MIPTPLHFTRTPSPTPSTTTTTTPPFFPHQNQTVSETLRYVSPPLFERLDQDLLGFAAQAATFPAVTQGMWVGRGG